MPAFSRAIAAMVEPSHSVWSSEMSVIDREQRIDDIGRVQPPAHAHFQHRHLHLRLGKVEQRLRRQNLEEAGKLRQRAVQHQLLRRIVHAKIEAGKGVVANLRAIQCGCAR